MASQEPQAILEARSVKAAFRLLEKRDPATRKEITFVTPHTLVSALHFLETRAMAHRGLFDPTVPESAQIAALGDNISRSACGILDLSLAPLEIKDPDHLITCCVNAFDFMAEEVQRFTGDPLVLTAEPLHSRLDVDEAAELETCAAWREFVGTSDPMTTAKNLAQTVLSGVPMFFGSKFAIGLLASGRPDLLERMKNLVEAAGRDDQFLLSHLIPTMIDRFRLRFLRKLAFEQRHGTVAEFGPRMLPVQAADYDTAARRIAQFSAKARRAAQESGELCRAVLRVAPVATLALLSMKLTATRGGAELLFESMKTVVERVRTVASGFPRMPGQLAHYLDDAAARAFDDYLVQLQIAPAPEKPWMERYAIPWVSAVVPGADAAADALPDKIKYLGDSDQKIKAAHADFHNLDQRWSDIARVPDLDRAIRSSVERHLGVAVRDAA